jgi:hypothetical protein
MSVSGYIHTRGVFAPNPTLGAGTGVKDTVTGYTYQNGMLAVSFNDGNTLHFRVTASGEVASLTEKQIAKLAMQLLAAAAGNRFDHLSNVQSLSVPEGASPQPSVVLKDGSKASPPGSTLYHARNISKKDGTASPSAVSGYDAYVKSGTTSSLDASSTAADRLKEAWWYAEYRIGKRNRSAGTLVVSPSVSRPALSATSDAVPPAASGDGVVRPLASASRRQRGVSVTLVPPQRKTKASTSSVSGPRGGPSFVRIGRDSSGRVLAKSLMDLSHYLDEAEGVAQAASDRADLLLRRI